MNYMTKFEFRKHLMTLGTNEMASYVTKKWLPDNVELSSTVAQVLRFAYWKYDLLSDRTYVS